MGTLKRTGEQSVPEVENSFALPGVLGGPGTSVGPVPEAWEVFGSTPVGPTPRRRSIFVVRPKSRRL